MQKKNVICYNYDEARHYTSACSEKKKQKSEIINATLFTTQLLKHTTIDILIETVSGHVWINTLVDSEVNLNFISQIKIKELELSESLEIGSINIHALNKGALHTYEWHTLGVTLTDQDSAEWERQL